MRDAVLLAALGPAEDDEAAPMSERVVCEHADRCGGCPIIALAYGEQLAMKRGRVVQSASRYPTLEMVYTEPVAAADPIVAYRTRAKLIASVGGRLGLYAKGGGHQVVDIPGCRVLSPTLAAVASALRERIVRDETERGPMAPYDPGGGAGALRAVDLREVAGEDARVQVLVTLVVHRGRARDDVRAALTEAATAFAKENETVAGIALSFHDGESPQVLGTETVVVYGAESALDRTGQARHRATYGGFVQAHRGQAERVHGTLVDLLGIERMSRPDGGRPRVLDLYGGAGAIGIALAHAGADVHLVESSAPSAAHAEEAAKSQSLPLAGEAADVASALRRLGDERRPFEAIVVNPPRRGMSPLARELLARLDSSTLAYVSSDPDTLARDLDHLSRLGFTISTLRPLDMIPLTDEVETIALLRRIGVPTPNVLYEDDDLLFVDKAPHEPTSPHADYASCLVSRARRLPSAHEVEAVHELDPGTSGLVMLVKNPDALPRWRTVWNAESTRKIFVAATRGVTPSKGAITRDLREDGKMYAARTRYRRLAVASGHSVLRVIPEQARAHQIRRHLAAIGHPVLGDDRYGHGPTNRFFEDKNALDRTFLHCVRVELDHPITGARMIIEAPMPGDLRGVLERTSGPGTLRFLEQKNALGRTGQSSLPPPPDSAHERGSALDVEPSRPSMRPELTNDDDDIGSRDSGRF